MVVKATVDPALLVSAVRDAVYEIDPDQPLYDVRPMATVVEGTLRGEWLTTVMMGAFGLMALTLAASGLYGVMTYGISHRMKEIGIRMALGASSRAIVRLVLSQSGRLVAIGVAIGATLSFSALALLRAVVEMKNVSILDPGAFMAAMAILLLAGAAAAYLPSRRATRIEPWKVLRGE